MLSMRMERVCQSQSQHGNKGWLHAVGRTGRGARLCPPLLTWPHPAYGMALWRTNSDVPAVTQEHRRLQGRAEHRRIPGWQIQDVWGYHFGSGSQLWNWTQESLHCKVALLGMLRTRGLLTLCQPLLLSSKRQCHLHREGSTLRRVMSSLTHPLSSGLPCVPQSWLLLASQARDLNMQYKNLALCDPSWPQIYY